MMDDEGALYAGDYATAQPGAVMRAVPKRGGRPRAPARRTRNRCCCSFADIPNCCGLLTSLPLMIVIGRLCYFTMRFAEPAENIAKATADIVGSVARMFEAGANVTKTLGSTTVDVIEGGKDGTRATDTGGGAHMLTLGPLRKDELLTLVHRGEEMFVPQTLMTTLNATLQVMLNASVASLSRGLSNYSSSSNYTGVMGMVYVFRVPGNDTYYVQLIFKRLTITMEWSNPVWKWVFPAPTILDVPTSKKIEHFLDASLLGKLNQAFWERDRLAGPQG